MQQVFLSSNFILARVFVIGFIITATGLLSFPQPASGSSHDTTPPTSPREVNALAINSTTVDVFWFPSMDNVGVTYNIYRAQIFT